MLRALVVFASAGLPVAAGSAVAGLHSIDLQGLDVQFAPEFEHDGRVNVSIKCLASHIADRHGPLSSAIQAAPGLYPGDSLGPTVWYNSDLVAGPDGPLGAGWQLEQLPYLFEVQTDEVTGTLTNYLGVSLGQDRVPYFEESTLDAAGGLRGVSLTRDENGTPLDPDDDVYTLLITRGMEWTAYDFASPTSTGSSTVAAAGTLLEVRTGRSTVIVADRHTDGQPATLLRTHAGSTVEDQLVLVYNIDDVVESIELQTRPDSTASFATVREVVFSYLDTTTAGIGVEGDLIGLEASIGGTPHAVQQFRYTDAAGLTMVVGTEGVRQAQLSDGVTPVLQKTAAALGSWSKLSADYDGTRVGTLRLAGDGCGWRATAAAAGAAEAGRSSSLSTTRPPRTGTTSGPTASRRRVRTGPA